MRSVPVYVKVTNTELEEKMSKVKDLLREIEKETAFISCKTTPTLYGVSAPEDDILVVGNIVVCGVACLSEEKRAQLHLYIMALLDNSLGFGSAESGKL